MNIMCKEISSQKRVGDISNDKNPFVTMAESSIQGHGFFNRGKNGRFVDSLESHGDRLVLFNSARRNNANIGICINEETSTSSMISDIKQEAGNGRANWTCHRYWPAWKFSNWCDGPG